MPYRLLFGFLAPSKSSARSLSRRVVSVVMNNSSNEDFADIISSNSKFVTSFQDEHLTGTARRGLAIVTCMDSRINPLAVVGMKSGDAKILRNAGARVTDDMLRTLVLATYLLGVERVLVMPHTDCRMASGDEESIHRSIETKHGINTRGVQFKMVTDQRAALAADVASIRSYEILPKTLKVAGAIYDVKSGRLEFIDC